MAIQNVTINYSAKKSNGQNVVFNLSSGGTNAILTATAPTRSAAETLIAAAIDNSIAIQQGNVDDQTDARGAFNS